MIVLSASRCAQEETPATPTTRSFATQAQLSLASQAFVSAAERSSTGRQWPCHPAHPTQPQPSPAQPSPTPTPTSSPNPNPNPNQLTHRTTPSARPVRPSPITPPLALALLAQHSDRHRLIGRPASSTQQVECNMVVAVYAWTASTHRQGARQGSQSHSSRRTAK